MPIQPAHATKNEQTLRYPLPPPLAHQILHLTQDSAAAVTTGTTLWLGAQVLTVYLYHLFPPASPVASSPSGERAAGEGKRKRALELGAGIGLTSLALAALGWDVMATDVAHLVSSSSQSPGLLARNVSDPRNAVAGRVRVQELDWCSPPRGVEEEEGADEGYDLVVTADTIFANHLVVPLFTCIKTACYPPSTTVAVAATATTTTTATTAGAQTKKKKTKVLVALEVRDPQLVARALEAAKGMGFAVRKVPQTRLRKVLRAAGLCWAGDEWCGVEVWQMALTGAP